MQRGKCPSNSSGEEEHAGSAASSLKNATVMQVTNSKTSSLESRYFKKATVYEISLKKSHFTNIASEASYVYVKSWLDGFYEIIFGFWRFSYYGMSGMSQF